MLALYRCGRQVDALEVYRSTRTRLGLRARSRARRRSCSSSKGGSSTTTRSWTPPAALPAELEHARRDALVGRSRRVPLAARSAGSGRARAPAVVVLLSGPRGIGKDTARRRSSAVAAHDEHATRPLRVGQTGTQRASRVRDRVGPQRVTAHAAGDRGRRRSARGRGRRAARGMGGRSRADRHDRRGSADSSVTRRVLALGPAGAGGDRCDRGRPCTARHRAAGRLAARREWRRARPGARAGRYNGPAARPPDTSASARDKTADGRAALHTFESELAEQLAELQSTATAPRARATPRVT